MESYRRLGSWITSRALTWLTIAIKKPLDVMSCDAVSHKGVRDLCLPWFCVYVGNRNSVKYQNSKVKSKTSLILRDRIHFSEWWFWWIMIFIITVERFSVNRINISGTRRYYGLFLSWYWWALFLPSCK